MVDGQHKTTNSCRLINSTEVAAMHVEDRYNLTQKAPRSRRYPLYDIMRRRQTKSVLALQSRTVRAVLADSDLRVGIVACRVTAFTVREPMLPNKEDYTAERVSIILCKSNDDDKHGCGADELLDDALIIDYFSQVAAVLTKPSIPERRGMFGHGTSANQETLLQNGILAACAHVNDRMRDAKLDDANRLTVRLPNNLCVAIVIEAVEQIGCPLQKATPGQALPKRKDAPQHHKLVDWLSIHMPVPDTTSDIILLEPLQAIDHWINDHKIVNRVGRNLTDVVNDRKDGPQILSGNPKG
ncbi:hypothetical protein FHL15_010939 [Xylaria flabelliformis]|uniref:Uncharacterized protein n=1 Tax=Xylaria flabelliformis TaxID=2512241 RepID=A0A553HJQ9_9PEZI|nr:hypothetical protein FHL15_010939 [Xylaria flabelliformis]